MREQSNHISTHRFPETACECCSAFPRKAKPDAGIAGARPTLTRGLALVTLKYRRMMLAHRLHDLSRASPPTLIGGQADRGSSRGTVQRDASGYRPTERGIRSHSSRAVREHLFSAKGAIYIFKQDKRLYPGPSGEDAVPFGQPRDVGSPFRASWCALGFAARNFVFSSPPGPPIRAPLTRKYAVRCTLRNEEEYHGR
jgi:hypothetical protein